LKGAFKNDIPVYFVNYDDIKKEIVERIEKIPLSPALSSQGRKGEEGDFELKLKQNLAYKDKIWFYSSDYSDILGMDNISGFLEEFVPFFENIPLSPALSPKGRKGVESIAMMEIRTKSANIKPILDLGFVPKNTEFAFSLNPQELIDKYEK
jgi:hypothetical protein